MADNKDATSTSLDLDIYGKRPPPDRRVREDI